ncbi:integrase catalytic domain-containing protein [Trichonephila clavata]|uniref:Integrase catalytic domain-containing protein n=1 Tax=Trichonephila clavata TaxID=2740835 RepID=A0A8X6LH10_TRICU|nr:integrase catalytic domain-containing protein [Trichonephila clavata]
MINSSTEVTDLDLNDFAKFQRRVRFHAKLFKDLKSRFRKEYLGLLAQKRSKPISHKMKVGEIVLVENPNKRLYWPLAKVLELLPSRDGNIRTMKLKCFNAEIIRPVQRLFPLEIQPEELPIAAVGMERVPEPSTLSEVPVAYTDEVNPPRVDRSDGKIIKRKGLFLSEDGSTSTEDGSGSTEDGSGSTEDGSGSTEEKCFGISSKLCSFALSEHFIPLKKTRIPEYCEALHDYYDCHFENLLSPKSLCGKEFSLQIAHDLMTKLCTESILKYTKTIRCAKMAIQEDFEHCKVESEIFIEKLKAYKGTEVFENDESFESCIKSIFRNECFSIAIAKKCVSGDFLSYGDLLSRSGAQFHCKNQEEYSRALEVAKSV